MTNRFIFSLCAVVALATFTSACQNTVGGNRDDIKAPLQEPLPTTVAIEDDVNVYTPEAKVAMSVPVNPINENANQHFVAANPVPTTVQPFVAKTVTPIQYVVQRNDNPWLIAEMYGVNVNELMTLNKISNASKLRIGQKLTIPAGGAFVEPSKRKVYKVPAKTKVEKKVTTTKTSKTTHTSPTKTTKTKPAPTFSGNEYVVAKGDFPAGIAKKVGCQTAELLALNGLTEKSILQIGQKLKVPTGGKVADATPAPTPVTPTATNTPTDSTTTPSATPVQTQTVTAPPAEKYEVMEAEDGETLRKISSLFNFSLDELVKLNPNLSPDQELKKGTRVFTPPF